MPRRRLTTRRSATHRITEALRVNIKAGIPWRQPTSDSERFGQADLVALVDGAFFHFTDFLSEDDLDTAKSVWKVLRGDILKQHIERKPLTRPWAWWFFEAPAMRRCWKIESVEDFLADKLGEQIDLEKELLDMPTWAKAPLKKNHFGMLGVSPGLCVYESEEEFLRRHKLLTKKEQKILEDHDA